MCTQNDKQQGRSLLNLPPTATTRSRRRFACRSRFVVGKHIKIEWAERVVKQRGREPRAGSCHELQISSTYQTTPNPPQPKSQQKPRHNLNNYPGWRNRNIKQTE